MLQEQPTLCNDHSRSRESNSHSVLPKFSDLSQFDLGGANFMAMQLLPKEDPRVVEVHLRSSFPAFLY